MKFWKYAPAAALTADGKCEVSSVDQYTYMVRIEGRIFFLTCEHFTNAAGPAVCIYMSQPIRVLDASGGGSPTEDEVIIIRDALKLAIPLFGRRVEFG